jgi:hypothetical protein
VPSLSEVRIGTAWIRKTIAIRVGTLCGGSRRLESQAIVAGREQLKEGPWIENFGVGWSSRFGMALGASLDSPRSNLRGELFQF